ncbi:MAG: Serine hydrolase [Verrucomicrobiales bacterium]|nr:Serine hydrolase [Verrucomicrobiales bacterium]
MSEALGLLPRTLSILEQGLQEGLHLGAQVYVSLRGKPLADFAIGDSKPGLALTTADLTLWLSSGKPITAIAVAQQFEKGRLALDDTVARHIPEFAQKGKQAITVAHLLTHTGGFRTGDKVPEDLGWDETISRICETPLEPAWVPGEKAGYHISSSWFILGEIVRRLDGRPYGQYVREEIFEPLEMRDSWLGMPAEAYRHYAERIAPMFNTEKGDLKLIQFWSSEQGCTMARPGSNARGPIRELGRFYEGLLAIRDGETSILQPETARLFTSPQRVGKFDQTFRHNMDTGYGFILSPNRYGPDLVSYGYGQHASDETFGHSGSQSSSGFADPKDGLVVSWVCNGMPGERPHQKRARAINTAIYEDLNLA